MDCLIGIIKEPEDEELRERGLFNAVSLECNLPVGGKTKKEAAEKLGKLLISHLKYSSDALPKKGIKGAFVYFVKEVFKKNRRTFSPTVYNEESWEELMKYCAENGFPEALPDIEMGYGLRLRCYDLTKVAAKVQ